MSVTVFAVKCIALLRFESESPPEMRCCASRSTVLDSLLSAGSHAPSHKSTTESIWCFRELSETANTRVTPTHILADARVSCRTGCPAHSSRYQR